jgi:hypothetical protein
VKSYSFQPLSRLHPLRQYKRRLALDGRPLDAVLNGDEIGLQKEFGGFTLLATHYDYFDGVEHWFYLLSDRGQVVDRVRMPDVFGFIQNVAEVSPNELAFGYFGSNDQWRIVVNERGFRAAGPGLLLKRLNRFFFAKRHLTLHRTKGPRFIFASEAGKQQPPT